MLLQVKVDPEAIARFGVPTRDVLAMVEAVAGKKVGEIREGQRRVPLVVRLPDRQRTDPDALAATLIPTAAGPVLPLNQVAKITEMEGPSTINHEWGQRRITVQCNVRGRDVKSFVAEGRAKIAAQVKLPEGYTIEWGGQFENMERANRKLMFVVPMALALIFVLLFFSLNTLREAMRAAHATRYAARAARKEADAAYATARSKACLTARLAALRAAPNGDTRSINSALR